MCADVLGTLDLVTFIVQYRSFMSALLLESTQPNASGMSG